MNSRTRLHRLCGIITKLLFVHEENCWKNHLRVKTDNASMNLINTNSLHVQYDTKFG